MQSCIAFSTSSTPLLGVSRPISLATPTEAELRQTESLVNTLHQLRSFESAEENQKRIEVLGKLNEIVKEWDMECSKSIEGYTPSAQLIAFGSFRLGVHSSGGDIDTLLVAPRHLNRTQFFSTFKRMLQDDVNVKDLNAVPNAFVPIITFHYSGIEIDVLFARLDMKQIPIKLDLSDDRLLRNLDQEDTSSINGSRVAERLLQLVPNQKEFKIALRAIKMWAKNHGIASNAMGFFGGITWAILVARTCQLYPNAVAAKIVQKVFFVFSTWKWPAPVLLDHAPMDDERVWNPLLNMADRHHLMPIVTPAYPQQNSTHNVSRSTLHIIQEEMKEALQLCKKIEEGEAKWTDFFEKVNFFSRHKHFLAVKMTAATKETQNAFTGFLESRIRQLVMALERNPVQLAHVHTSSFKGKENNDLKDIYFIGLNFAEHARNLDLTRITDFFKVKLMEQAARAKVPMVQIDISYVKRCHLATLLPIKDLTQGRFWKSTGDQENKKRKAMDSAGGPAAKRPLQCRNN